MFALEVEYLAGRSVATARHDRESAEWPPHPGRLFCALVAACHEGDLTEDEREAGRSALLWLERQASPAISVSAATHRDVLPVFVPVNDKNEQCKIDAKKKVKFHPAINGEIAIRRGRQERTFPSVTPTRPILHFVWTPAAGIEQHLPALARLAACVTYLGHSSSLVRVSVADAPGEITYAPAERGDQVLRVPAAGRLEELERAYRRQARPSPGTYQPYRLVGGEQPSPARPAESVFGDLIVCQIDGRSFLPLNGALRLTDAVRQAVLQATDRSGRQVKSLVSGHTDAGGVSRADHVAYVPLANIGHRHADGKVMGFAVVLPRHLGRFSPERREILRAVAGLDNIGFADHAWAVTLVGADAGLQSLRTDAYTADSASRRKRSRRWASVTPVLCDRFPKDKDGERVEDIIADSVERVVGCRPRVEVDKISRFRGVPPSFRFHRERKEADVPRYRTHAVLEFDREVQGPLLVGAGRFLGLGLFRVWEPDREGIS
jgi:CRISPR-associated protein Csb2